MDQREREERNKCLLLWIKSIPPFASKGINPQNDLFKDGMMTSRVLKNIDPTFFADLKDTPKESTELVKVVDKMKKYLLQVS